MDMMQDLAIEANGLRKRYGQTTVLDGLDLRVPRASVFALLGPKREAQKVRAL
jgi:ABC-2 type transport system ATP-binding protein